MRRSRRGFTLIELLIVAVILSILATIVISRFWTTRNKAYVAAMKSDLKNLASAQELYFGQYLIYSNNTGALGLYPSPQVTVTITAATTQGWSAQATHGAVSGSTCAIYVGAVSAVAPASEDGVIACQ